MVQVLVEQVFYKSNLNHLHCKLYQIGWCRLTTQNHSSEWYNFVNQKKKFQNEKRIPRPTQTTKINKQKDKDNKNAYIK